MQRIDVDNVGLVGRVSELQVLRDKIDIDQPPRNMLQVPEIALAFFQGDGAPHVGDIDGNACGLARPRQNPANDLLDFAAEFR